MSSQDWIGVLPLGEGLVSIPLPELFTGECTESPVTRCVSSEYTVAGTALSSASTVGIPVISSDAPQAVFIRPPKQIH